MTDDSDSGLDASAKGSPHPNVLPIDVKRLEDLGWTPALAAALSEIEDYQQLEVGRVFDERRGVYSVVSTGGTSLARVTGRFRHQSRTNAELPVVGDWVAFRRGGATGAPARQHQMGTIRAVLPRRTKIARKVAGDRTDEQVLAANVDTAIILMGLDGDLNLRRLDRYVAMVRAGDVDPIVLLTKSDLFGIETADWSLPARTPLEQEARSMLEKVVAAIPGVTVLPLSLLSAPLPPILLRQLQPMRTLVLLGSSGVGKSTLLNRLIGRSIQQTSKVRASDSRGRHTTTHRQMFTIDGGAFVIDTPGLREIQLHVADPLPDDAFPDIAALAPQCRFRDCHHDQQPGCAVEAAVENGTLPASRLQSYQRLRGSRSGAPRFHRPGLGAGRRGTAK